MLKAALHAACCSFFAAGQTIDRSTIPFEVSEHDDIANQERAMSYFEPKYYNNENKWSLNEESLQEVHRLAQISMQIPSLVLPVAQVLYLYGWYRRTGEVIRENVIMAARLFEMSISIAGCSKDLSVEAWLMLACEVRFGHAMIIDNWLGETEKDAAQAQEYISRSFTLLDMLKLVPRFAEVSKAWNHPLAMNFNQLKYRNPVSMPIWDTQSVPLGRWLEENYPIFREELDAIVNHPEGDVYEMLRRADGSIESLAPPGTWDAIRIVRYGHWFDGFCSVAPRTCELLRSRPEIASCPYVNTNYYKLHPGGHLKPHFGNAPRLTAHLTVIAPEPLRSGFSVGTARALWTEGKALIVDDTYPHAVSHWGTKPRYVLASWFCHPCDTNNDNGGATCPDWVGSS
eukprot:gnl/TRDRNA2_/TRDRNA2_134744_c0_seq1.p1 gnl/TRDRNA2_/TRDRNA2_134744_c0~~gnl/TRDRNA2_/TRDRNA2_134744_c0_seq1.p1  ORF type:complete len:400 (+),score=36.44 gnl/TRDRNA2_/TRDRNA2_134744_c0_seq1:97-1296(+)